MKRYERYKDSGVQWIGEIPEHWECAYLKRILSEKMQYDANEPAESNNPEYPRYIRITDIATNGELKECTFKSLEPQKAKDFLLKKGDILFARSGATVGKTFLFNSNIDACYAGYLIKASCNREKMRPTFLYYYTQSSAYEYWKNSTFIQATIQNIGADKYQMMFVPIPTIPEQNAIVGYLKDKTLKIDQYVAARERESCLTA